MRKIIFFLFLVLPLLCAAKPVEPIPADQAFQFTATARDYQTILAIWKIKKGYYLYRDRIHFTLIKPRGDKIGLPLLPASNLTKDYPGIGVMKVYANEVRIPIPVINSTADHIVIQADYQGCSEMGFCYPPVSKIVSIDLSGNYMIPTQPIDVDVVIPTKQNQIKGQLSPQENVANLLKQHNWLTIILSFLGFGLLISFTPCVLPMIPILSGIIIGHGKISHSRSFALSFSYVIGMAITYAIAGALFGAAGSTVQAYLQQPWIIILFSVIFVAMALSLFGLYNIQLPEKLRSKVAHISQHQKHGSFVGVFIMGVLSTLILSPCVTAPLVGVLGYISQTGNALIGATALFCMGMGMGVPLLIVGMSSAKLLPKAGAWMNITKYIMGVAMLAIAIWMLSRILSDTATMFLWALLSLGTAVAMGALSTAQNTRQKIGKGLGLILFVYGILLTVGALSGMTNPLQPISLSPTQSTKRAPLPFKKVSSIEGVMQALEHAKEMGKPVMLDFYADWCMSCIEMDRTTFQDLDVQTQLKKYVLLRADVTQNTSADKALEKHFDVIAPPTILFFTSDGKEQRGFRIVGEQSATALSDHLKKLSSS